jgi:hypothetical protein
MQFFSRVIGPDSHFTHENISGRRAGLINTVGRNCQGGNNLIPNNYDTGAAISTLNITSATAATTSISYSISPYNTNCTASTSSTGPACSTGLYCTP